MTPGGATVGPTPVYPAAVVERQLKLILRAWGMPPGHVEACARAMLYADLRGIDAHGFAMLPIYDDLVRQEKVVPGAEVRLVREAEALALFDAGHGLGHPASERACGWAVERARRLGLATAWVRNSNHFGAAGYYAELAASAGMIGLAGSGTPGRTVVPPLGKEPRLGALPLAFAAPSARGRPVVLDIAVSTVAMGKINLARLAGTAIPEGWAIDLEGRPLTDADEAFRLKRLTPFGGHKGYGLGVMVEILASLVSGSKVGGADLETGEQGQTLDIGHFFVALDPCRLAEGSGSFGAAVDLLAEFLRSTPPIDPARPVLAPGDPEQQALAVRESAGIPLLPRLVEEIRSVARRSGAEVLI